LAITNYTDLQSTVADWLHRSDLTPVIPTFIQLAEKQLSRQLRLKNQQTEATGAAATTIALPSDYVEAIALFLTVGSEERPLRQKDRYSGARINNMTADTAYYTIEGSSLLLAPPPAGTETYTLQYYAAIPALSGVAQTNWLITEHPDLYLYAVLLQSAPYVKDDARLATWQAAYVSIKTAIDDQDMRDQWSGSPLSNRANMSCW